MIRNTLIRLLGSVTVSALFIAGGVVAQTVGVGTMSQGTISYSTGSALARVMNDEMGLQARVQPNSGETTLLPLINNAVFQPSCPLNAFNEPRVPLAVPA